MKQAHVLIAGCGDLGCALGQRLITNGLGVIGLRRSDAPLPDGMLAVKADVTQPQTLRSLAALKPDILVYCVAADASTDDSYRAHYVDGLRNVLAALKDAASLRHVFFVSSTRVYGQQADDLLDETTPAIPTDFGGQRLLEAEALLNDFPCPGTALRLSGIYGPGRTRMLTLAQQPRSWPAQNTWTNRIHRDDAVAFIAFLIHRVLNNATVDDCYVVTDNRPTPQYEVLMWLAEQLGVDVGGVKVPPVQGGKRLSNQRMCDLGFKLDNPTYRTGYGNLLARRELGISGSRLAPQ